MERARAVVLTSALSTELRALFSFDAPATTEIYTLSLHDALPISTAALRSKRITEPSGRRMSFETLTTTAFIRSEEHTSELQSRGHLVCRLLLEKKNAGSHTLTQHPKPLSRRPESNPRRRARKTMG